MIQTILTPVSYVAGALALCGCGYYVLCLSSAARFKGDMLRRAPRQSAFLPPVSILKPLRGTDREMYESFRSHCLQEYPEYEIIFGLSESDDPAMVLVERLKREFPERRIELVFCEQALGTNIKVSNLAQMLPHAQHDHIVVNDSDIRVTSDYLREVISPLGEVRAGLATALYRGAPGRTLWSRLESLGIVDFAAGVLAAKVVEGGIRFGLGSTLVFKREALDAIGGFEPLLDYLGDDYELGKRMAGAGYGVVLSHKVVDTFVPEYDWSGFWRHQLRWMRTVRASRSGGYAGLVFTFALPFAITAVVLSGASWWSGVLLGLALVLRFGMAWQVAVGVLSDRRMLRHFWLIPLRDALAPLVWLAGYFGNTISWRDNELRLRNGKLERVSASGTDKQVAKSPRDTTAPR